MGNVTQRNIESSSVQFGQVKSEVKWSEVQRKKVPLRYVAVWHVTSRGARSGWAGSSYVKSGQVVVSEGK